MNSKKSQLKIEEKKASDIDNPNDFLTISDLMQEQKVSIDDVSTVHHRRDLDSLG